VTIIERPPLAHVGRSVPRRDAHEKLRGAAQFVGDFVVPRMVHGKVLRSPFAHARVLAVDATEAEALPGVVCVLTGEDLADLDPYWGHAIKDRPIVALDRVRFAGRPAFRASATVSGSIFVYDFEPKPPPRYGTWIRTFATGTLKRSAISARTRNGCWHVAHSVISSPSNWAITVCVSIAYW